ncbi:Calmodulin-binding protein 60 A [Linum perenne]
MEVRLPLKEMPVKRRSGEDLTSESDVVQEAMKMRALECIMEPLIRRVVKEEIESALKKHLISFARNSGKEGGYTELRYIKLHFSNNLSLPIFTGARVEGDDSSTLQVVLIDNQTGKVVNVGPESSARVEVVVLEGDFDNDECNNWTPEEFKNNIVKEREGKKPLLSGDVFLNLKDGVSLVGDVSFSDNSSWTRSRKFRIGARSLDIFDGIRIIEAKSESFIVRDHRGELYKKHHPPALSDEVWRLEKIGKDGAFHKRLCRENILTVKDFLTQLFINPPKLRHILGTGMSAKMWEVTVEHAQTCILDNRIYLYFSPGQPKISVVFNIVGQVRGLLSDCQYVPVDKMSETEKVDAHNLVVAAFGCWDEVICCDDETSLVAASSNLNSVPYSSSSSKTENSNSSKALALQKVGEFDFAQPSASSPDIVSSLYSVGGISNLGEYDFHGIENMGLRYDQTFNFASQVPNPLINESDSITQALCDDDHLRFFNDDLQSQNLCLEAQADLQSAVDGFLLARSTAVAIGSKAQRRWAKISSVLRWFSVRKLVAKRNRVRDVHDSLNVRKLVSRK